MNHHIAEIIRRLEIDLAKLKAALSEPVRWNAADAADALQQFIAARVLRVEGEKIPFMEFYGEFKRSIPAGAVRDAWTKVRVRRELGLPIVDGGKLKYQPKEMIAGLQWAE